MRVISVMNLKGGVGKTTTTVNMAAILARDYDKRVIVIDADPQGNATDFFGARGEPGLAEWYRCPDPGEAVFSAVQTVMDGVSIVPGCMDLIDLDIKATPEERRENFLSICRLCDGLSDEADVILIDCPPCFTTTSIGAVMASEDIIIPVKPDGFVFSGVGELQRQIDGLRTVNPLVKISGALITMWHNAEAVTAGVSALRESGIVPVFRTVIRRTDKVDESTYARQTLDTWSPYSSAGRDYKAFVAEYMGV